MTWWTSSRRSERVALGILALGLAAGTPLSASAGDPPRFGEWRTFRKADGLPSDKVFCVLADGPVTWAGTDAGLARLEGDDIRVFTAESGLPHAVVNGLAVSGTTGDLWVATMGGLARFSGGRFDSFTQLSSGLINDVVYSVAVRGDDVWAATAAGTSVYHTAEHRWELFDHTNTLMHEPWCYGVTTTPSAVYVAVWGGGVVEQDPATGVWKEYRDPDGEMEIDLFRDDGLIHDVTTGVSYGDGLLWVATYFGLSRYDGRHWRSWLDHDSGLPSNFINYVWADGPAAWVCTDRGLAWTDGVTWIRYTAGLPEEDSGASGAPVRWVPQSIANDFVLGFHRQGDVIWVATADGLSRGQLMPRAPGS